MAVKWTGKDKIQDKMRGRKEVYRIPVDPDGKQILVLRGANIPQKDFEDFVNTVQAWGKSDDPILVAQVAANVEIILIRSEKHARAR